VVLSQLSKTANGILWVSHPRPLFGWEEVSNPWQGAPIVIHSLKEWQHILEGTKHMIEIINDHRNLTHFRHLKTESLASMLVPLACKVWFPSSPQAGATLHETQHTLALGRPPDGRWRTIETKWCFQLKGSKLSWAKPNQSTIVQTEMAPPKHYQGEGTEFLERVHNCADRETW